MPIAYPHVAERVFGRAHAIEPAAMRAIVDSPIARRILTGKSDIEIEASPKIVESRRKRLSLIVQAEPVKLPGDIGEYAITSGGIAIVPVMGVLSQRFDWLAALCGWTTYEGLLACFAAMLADYRVRAILLDIDSPGGEAAGMLDVADAILAARSEKPVWAVANSYAASAGYGIAGSAECLFVPRLGKVGSIGAVMVHLDESAYDTATGSAFTAVYSGARKVDGWDHAPLSEPARAVWQASVDHCRAEFAALIGRQGRITAEAAIATEAGMFADRAAVEAGLADEVGTFDDALTKLTELVAQARGAPIMTTQAKPVAATGEPKPAAVAVIDAKPVLAAGDPPKEPAAIAAPAISATAMVDPVKPPAPAVVGPAIPATNAYGIPDVLAVLDLCIIGNASLAQARTYIATKTSIETVRTELVAAAASAADAREISPARSQVSQTAGWDEVTTAVNKQFGVSARQ